MRTRISLLALTLSLLSAWPASAAFPALVDSRAETQASEVSHAGWFGELLSPERIWRSSAAEAPDFGTDAGLVELVRGQTPTYDNGGGTSPFYDDGGAGYPNSPSGPIYPTDPNSQFAAPAPMVVDPFLNPQMGPGPEAMPGVNGPQPYRYGWTLRSELEYFTGEAVTGPAATGDLEVFGLNIELEKASPWGGGWVFIHRPEFGWRSLQGPTQVNAAGNGLPASLYHFGWDFKWVTPTVAGWGWEFAFDPSINTDLNGLDGNGFNLDGRAALFWQWNPSLTVIGGVMYWDRVRDRVLPYGGVVWQPNQLWEVRLMYPESRIKLFLGNYAGHAKWLYFRAEYHSEAYQLELDGLAPAIDTKWQVDDWRIALGLQSEDGYTASFVEAGWVFDRETRFIAGAPGFDIGSAFLVRAGMRF